MEEKALPLPSQFGSFVVPVARAISAPSSFAGVTFEFVGRVVRVLDSDEDDFSIGGAFSVGDPVTGSITYDDRLAATGPAATRAAYPTAPAATLAIGSSFRESLPFAQSLPGLEMVVENDSGGYSLNLGSDFLAVKSPIFPTTVEAAMVISLAHSAGFAFLHDVPPSSITLHDFDDTHFLITFFDTASGSVSFLEVELERFTTKETANAATKESLAQARRGVAQPAGSINGPEERRLTMRRVDSWRSTLRAYPNGKDRRHQRGRRKEDKRNTMKAVLLGLFSLPSRKTRRPERNA